MEKVDIWEMPRDEPELLPEPVFDPSGLPHGVYYIYWKTGGRSVAAVGSMYSGKRWMAPANWTCSRDREEAGISPGTTDWSGVERAELIAKNSYGRPEEED